MTENALDFGEAVDENRYVSRCQRARRKRFSAPLRLCASAPLRDHL